MLFRTLMFSGRCRNRRARRPDRHGNEAGQSLNCLTSRLRLKSSRRHPNFQNPSQTLLSSCPSGGQRSTKLPIPFQIAIIATPWRTSTIETRSWTIVTGNHGNRLVRSSACRPIPRGFGPTFHAAAELAAISGRPATVSAAGVTTSGHSSIGAWSTRTIVHARPVSVTGGCPEMRPGRVITMSRHWVSRRRSWIAG